MGIYIQGASLRDARSYHVRLGYKRGTCGKAAIWILKKRKARCGDGAVNNLVGISTCNETLVTPWIESARQTSSTPSGTSAFRAIEMMEWNATARSNTLLIPSHGNRSNICAENMSPELPTL
jgi:hypothetical protein